MKQIVKYTKRFSLMAIGSLLLICISCINDLDQENPRNTNVSDIVNEEVCRSFLAKIYSGFGLSSNIGPASENDLSGGDQGSLVFLRGLLTMQEFPTDEVCWNWKDAGIVELTTLTWDYTTIYAYTFYQRAMLNIRYCKEFLDVYTESTGIPNIRQYRDEVRAIRALNYYYLIDLYGNPGIVWDDSPVQDKTWYPTQIGRKPLFDKIVAELKDLEEKGTLPATPSMATYAKMTKQVVQTILAKLYMNAEVYTGTPMYQEASDYCVKVMDAGFGLVKNYSNLFCADNYLTPMHGNEIIFAIPFDDVHAKSYGNVIMLSTGACGGELNGNWFGNTSGGWSCMKTKGELIAKFKDSPDDGLDRFKSKKKEDSRYLFFDILDYDTIPGVVIKDKGWPFDPVTGEILYEVVDRRSEQSLLGDWQSGYLCYKFTNLPWDWDGKQKPQSTDFPNTDFPLFRIADIYLMYAECAVRGYGDKAKALALVNSLRDRAYKGKASGQITVDSDLDLDFIIDERARELYWEGHRRSDLIRFGLFTQGYAWTYKGGSVEGSAKVNKRFNLYPISDKDLTSNPLLKQNPGYKSIR